ncbi:flagellar hook-associated protein FlgK [Methylosinus sp. H3A]|uniref:flagellar hook-associated protein FlgK n=1 Tax=Methylosinus sp. H3A TaxID=2785786 RepID=UPI0018C1D3F0|nr:flagellar hook-associated protein FlgK [Methylosinus sp. H3A]MBG0808621.1 flagellar hook-associated protein FlgK [Methylosinus sp. H3A]
MSLTNAGAIANQSLGTIAAQINVVSRNIAGVNVSGYATKTALVSTSSNGAAQIDGVARATNAALFQNSLQASATQAAAAALSSGFDQIDQALGLSSGSATDTSTNRSPAALLSALKSALQSYSASPSDTTVAQTVLSSAKAVAQALNTADATVQQLRAQADGEIASSVANINSILTQFQQVNSEIVAGTQTGRDVTSALDQRDALLKSLSSEIGVTTVTRANNDMVIYADGGATLFETSPRAVTFQATSSYTASTTGNAVYVDGVPVTGASASMAIQSGKLQGLTQLRDVVAPQYQNQLDETARGLIAAFAETDQSGLGTAAPGLFTYAGATSVPGASVVPGLAGQIIVNPNADPSQGGDLDRLRDGGISDPTNSAYSYNTTGAAGFTDRINQLVASFTTSQSFDPSAGLGSSASLMDYTTSSLGWFEAQRQQATETESYQSTLLSQTTDALSNATGVNLDEQMSKMLDLENSYQASAKLIAAIDAMYTALFQAL